MMNKMFFSLGILFLLASPVLSLSSLGTFDQYSNLTLKQFCGECSYVNLTSVVDPDGILVVGENYMSKTGSTYTYYSPSLNLTSKRGQYIVAGYGDTEIDGNISTFSYVYDVVSTNDLMFNINSPLYITLLVVFILISFFLLYIGQFIYSGFILMLLGLSLLVSDFNSILSTVVIAIGVVIVFIQK